MSGDFLRYGVIGTGMMGVEHIENIGHLDDAVVVAIADTDATSRESGARAAGGDVQVFDDHRRLLDDAELDAVVIVTPNHTHADVLGDVLDREHLHVMVEKPLCTTVADCRRMVEAASRTPSRVAWMGLEYRYMPPTTALLDEVRSGLVGRVRMVAVREHRFPFLVKVDNWNRFNRNTGGTLVEKCCHFFDLMNLVIGTRPTRVFATGGQDVNHLDERYDGEVPDILDNAYVIVDYEGGARAMLDLCMFAEATTNEQELVVVGDEGKVEALVTQGVIRTGRRSDGWLAVAERPVVAEGIRHQGLHHGASYLEHVDFARCIRDGGQPAVTLTDGLWAVAVGEAAHRSIEARRPIDIAEVLE